MCAQLRFWILHYHDCGWVEDILIRFSEIPYMLLWLWMGVLSWLWMGGNISHTPSVVRHLHIHPIFTNSIHTIMTVDGWKLQARSHTPRVVRHLHIHPIFRNSIHTIMTVDGWKSKVSPHAPQSSAPPTYSSSFQKFSNILYTVFWLWMGVGHRRVPSRATEEYATYIFIRFSEIL